MIVQGDTAVIRGILNKNIGDLRISVNMVCAQEIMVDIRTREEVFGAIETAKGWLSPRG